MSEITLMIVNDHTFKLYTYFILKYYRLKLIDVIEIILKFQM